ncbi:SpaH/EbpB family LPXTG-anchored major pilin [Microbacterium lacticum]|uniref:SpaH/EbpB family LPXTG-anchored major pilin n=1 Tax=Microbacterium lacticum TaxID=33885 RepID=UPI001F597ACE|nr:SpaH/EbpB family LPXTG-anchored major pilin [Microbacterium lacticum]
MKDKKLRARRVLSGAAALGLGVVGILGASGAAYAADGPGQDGAPQVATLVIHKHAGSPTGDVNNGTEQDVERPALGGVPFTAQRIGTTVDGTCVAIDLTTSAGWTAVEGITADPQTVTPCNAGTPLSGTTDATGTITWADQPLGLYYVAEGTADPALNITVPAAPFYVTLPYPTTTGSGDTAETDWLYTVHVYPKNTTEGEGSKTVADPGAHGLGESVPWTIKTRPIGTFDGGAPLTSYSIIDELDQNLLYADTTSLQYLTPGGTLTTVPAANYTIVKNPAGATVAGGTVTVGFTQPGVAWVNTLPAGTVFQWDLTTTVVGVGVLENKSFENTGGEDVNTGSATTDWGQAKLLKHETNDESKVLSGAEFQVYDVNADGSCTAPLEGAPITVASGTTSTSIFESDAAGVVDIAGLYVGENGDPAARDYCIVETKAPAGYTLVSTPIQITVAPGAVADGEWSAKVANPPVEGPGLPLTGGNGTAAMVAGGVALVALAGGAVLVTRRKVARR